MTLMNLKKLKESIDYSDKIVLIVGSGISTDEAMLSYKKENIEKILSMRSYNENPIVFWKYFKSIFNYLLENDIQPNENYYFAEDLINEGKDVCVVTKNIDGLFSQIPGLELNRNYFEINGNVTKFYCTCCDREYEKEWVNQSYMPYCENVDCTELLRPHMVLPGEENKYISQVIQHIKEADLILVMGTSFSVYPINDLLRYSKGSTKILINKEIIRNHTIFDYLCVGDIEEYVKEFKSEKRIMREELENKGKISVKVIKDDLL